MQTRLDGNVQILNFFVLDKSIDQEGVAFFIRKLRKYKYLRRNEKSISYTLAPSKAVQKTFLSLKVYRMQKSQITR